MVYKFSLWIEAIVDFPGNSHSSRKPESEKPADAPKAEGSEEKKVQSVVTGKVTRRKPGLGKRFKEIFFAAEAQSVGEYIIFDVLVPAIRDTVVDAITQSVRKMAYGESRPASRANMGWDRPAGASGYVSYNRMGAPSRREPERPSMSRQARATHNFDEVILDLRSEAEDVIEKMYILLERYRQVTLVDFYDLLGQSSHYTDEAYGWTSLRGAQVVKVGPGYLLDLPRPEPLPVR
jgi:hypothetical protein